MIKCKVCGKCFVLKRENKYLITKNPVGFNVLTTGDTVYECYDCPKCGCQIIANIREMGAGEMEVADAE